jgi:hypothetical protein
MKKQLLILTLGIVGLLAACSPAAVTSGSYTGTFSSSSLPSPSGNGTANITTVNDNTVNIKIGSSGNPDVSIDGVTVTKISVPGVTEVSFSGSNSLLSLSGTYVEGYGVNVVDLTVDSAANSYSVITFSGHK